MLHGGEGPSSRKQE
jgi:hypothetical protein